MSSDFRMQASRPTHRRANDTEDETLCDAIQSVFPLDTENAYMVWNGVHIPLNYKYTISFMIDDALLILEKLVAEESGEMSVQWPVQEFAASWQLRWEGHDLTVEADWGAVGGGCDTLLGQHSTLKVDKFMFAAEWKRVLGIVLRALLDSGYGEQQLPDLIRLQHVHESIRGAGVLYQEAGDSDG